MCYHSRAGLMLTWEDIFLFSHFLVSGSLLDVFLHIALVCVLCFPNLDCVISVCVFVHVWCMCCVCVQLEMQSPLTQIYSVSESSDSSEESFHTVRLRKVCLYRPFPKGVEWSWGDRYPFFSSPPPQPSLFLFFLTISLLFFLNHHRVYEWHVPLLPNSCNSAFLES